MRWHLQIVLFSVVSVLLSTAARAQDTSTRYGFCHTESGDFALYSTDEVDTLTVVSSVLDSSSGLNLTTQGQVNRAGQRIDLPGYWRPNQLHLSDCRLSSDTSLLNLSDLVLRALRPPVDIPMRLQSYFIEGDPSQDIDLPALIRDHAAFPVQIHIICTMSGESAPSALACSKIRILEHTIPVNPPYGSVSAQVNLSSVVGLDSSLCQSAGPTKRSSASVISWQNKTYLLTAATAVLSQFGTQSCNEAILSDGRHVPLNLVRQDYARGLALLQPTSGSLGSGLEIRGMSPDDLPDRANLVSASSTQSMELLADESNRHFIPRLNSAIEILGGDVNAAWVGAALIDNQGELIGLNSDEYLKIFPGSLTRPIVWSGAADEKANHLVVIPARAILDWLNAAPEPSLWQINTTGPLQLQSGSLLFSEDCPPLDATQPVGQYPIGGLDPVGIGGDSSNYRACRIRVTRAATNQGSFFESRQQPWADDLSRKLDAGDSIELDYHVWRDGGQLQRSYFYSAQSFFQELAAVSDGHLIVELVTPPGTTQPGLDPKLAVLRVKASTVAAKVRELYLADDFGDPTASLLLRQVYLLTTLLQSEQWNQVQAGDFEWLLAKDGAFAKAWGLIELGFGGVGIHNSLPDLEQALKAVQ